MQKNNKFLVWTIWIATISFIGTGATMSLSGGGASAGTVATVGDIEISQTKLNVVYSRIYGQVNQQLKGKLDDEKAKKMGLIKQAFSQIATQAKVLNFAKDLGIVVSDEELVLERRKIEGFQKDGVFSREVYDNYLKSQRLKAKDFEATLREEITINKTMALLNAEALPLEIEAIGTAMNIADKILYKVLTTSDIAYVSDKAKIQTFWENQKENYMSKKKYELSLLWTSSADTNITDEELKNHYETNSFNYTDGSGKQLLFDAAKASVEKDLKLKKTKKSAQKAYIAFKKGIASDAEKITLQAGDLRLTQALWSEIKTKSIGDILKPKVVGEQYVTVKIESAKEPQVMSYEQAKEQVTSVYDIQAKKEGLLTLSETTLSTLSESNANMSDFVTINDHDNLKSLNSQESLQFFEKLFTSNKEKGIITLLDKVIVYNIIEQKLLPADNNQTDLVKKVVNRVKNKTFESNFLKMLDKQYPTEVYIGGLIN